MYWLGYVIVLAGAGTYAAFKNMSAADKQNFLRKLGL